MNKSVKTKDLFDCKTPYLTELFEKCTYPWEMLPDIKNYIKTLVERGMDGFTEISEGVFVGENVKIYPTAVIEPPAIIGAGTEIRPGAFIRGSVITGANCVIGNSTELKNCILFDGVQVPHYNYVGDSILGYKAHLGAGAITSNVKSDKTLVVIKSPTECVPTERKKVGAFLGDNVEVGCNSVLNPGTVIGKNSRVYPLSCVRGVIEENCIYKQGGIVKIR